MRHSKLQLFKKQNSKLKKYEMISPLECYSFKQHFQKRRLKRVIKNYNIAIVYIK